MVKLFTMLFRPNTWDAEIWKSIVDHNEYGIQGFWHGDVIDIGGHIGSFSYLMAGHKEAKKIVVIEPDPDNYRVLTTNLQSFIDNGTVDAINAGIGLPDHKLCLEASPGDNTGGGYYKDNQNGTINTIQLDDIINMFYDRNYPILLKIDCEGCEYEALESCSQLHKISCILGEFHVRGLKNETSLKTLLESQNFIFHSHHTGVDIGLFGAHKPA